MKMLRKTIYSILVAAIVLMSVPIQTAQVAKAAEPETVECADNDNCWKSDKVDQCVGTTAVAPATPGNEKLPDSVPAPYHDIFISAANAQGASAPLVAAIFFAGEHGSSWPNPPPPYGTGGPWATSNKGANGPFQFLIDTWEGQYNNGYKRDGDGDGDMDIQDLVDAAHGAASYLAASGGKPGADTAALRGAIFEYNRANWYVDNVMEAYNVFVAGGTAASGAPIASGAGSCGGNIGVSPDGFVFPQKTTKAQLKQNGWSATCTNKVSEMGLGSKNPVEVVNGLCHHHYLAADILNSQGVAVVSPRPGRVIATKDKVIVNGLESGASVRIYSDPALGGDGLYYYLTHMLPKYKDPNAGVAVKVDDVVTAGQFLGVVGSKADAQNTIPHTHFDVSPIVNDFSRSSEGAKGPLLDPQPALKASYDKLPDN